MEYAKEYAEDLIFTDYMYYEITISIRQRPIKE